MREISFQFVLLSDIIVNQQLVRQDFQKKKI